MRIVSGEAGNVTGIDDRRIKYKERAFGQQSSHHASILGEYMQHPLQCNVGEDLSHEQTPKQYCGKCSKKVRLSSFLKRMNIKRGFPFEIGGGNGFVRI